MLKADLKYYLPSSFCKATLFMIRARNDLSQHRFSEVYFR